MAGHLKLVLLGGVLCLAGSVALAQIADPTRPAVDESAPGNASGGDGGAAPSNGLQTIIRRKGAKPAAIINGEYVELGGRVGESRLSAVGEDSVVLSGPGGKETMAMTPGIEKKPAKPVVKKASGKASGKPNKQMRSE